MCSLVSVKDISREEVEYFINDALQRKTSPPTPQCKWKVLASLFYENSTRTRESHERAARRLGMDVMGFSGTEGTSVKKGEPLADTLRMYEGYGADVIVLRHPLEGAARYAAEILNIPVINAGDGSNGHPTQALLDLMTIKEKHGSIDNLRIALVGDLRYGRTVHSLIAALILFSNVQLWLVAPDTLQMPSHLVAEFEKATGMKATQTQNLTDVLAKVDIIYMTRIQRERFPEGLEGEYEYKKVSGIYCITTEMLKNTSIGIMHPLPRYKGMLELSMDVDQLPNAWYIEQAKNGLYMREAILHKLLSATPQGIQKPNSQKSMWNNLPITNGQKRGEHMVYRLDNGTLIDHIGAGKGKDVLKVLALPEDMQLIYAHNLRSSRYGKKDVLGFTDRELSETELDKVALVAPEATINIIKDEKVMKKGKIILPSVIESLVLCPNPRCITAAQHQEHVPQKMIVESHDPLILRCYYCEVPIKREEIVLKEN
ncbi:aspartate carbamoyltransferase [Candidatus Woesearchaeota archaeon]|nr:aspartate carbamoyltransferase [Candidatus Woesearchaeota archaeon]